MCKPLHLPTKYFSEPGFQAEHQAINPGVFLLPSIGMRGLESLNAELTTLVTFTLHRRREIRAS